jgi:hypothetical protein
MNFSEMPTPARKLRLSAHLAQYWAQCQTLDGKIPTVIRTVRWCSPPSDHFTLRRKFAGASAHNLCHPCRSDESLFCH